MREQAIWCQREAKTFAILESTTERFWRSGKVGQSGLRQWVPPLLEQGRLPAPKEAGQESDGALFNIFLVVFVMWTTLRSVISAV